MTAIPALPPGYRYSRNGKRISIRYPKTEQVNQTMPGFWYREENAAKAAWKYYEQTLLEQGNTIDAQDALDVFPSPDDVPPDEGWVLPDDAS